MTVKKRLYLLYIHIMSYDTYRGYLKPPGLVNPNELILLRYHKLNREKTSQRNTACLYLFIFCRLNLDYKLPKKKKKKSLLSLIPAWLEGNIMLYKWFLLINWASCEGDRRQESDQIHTCEKQRQKQDCIKTKSNCTESSTVLANSRRSLE